MHGMAANRKLRRNIDDDMDRISELPEPIIHHIMSFLPARDVVRTSTLCKIWKTVHASFPILDFNQTIFGESLAIAIPETAKKHEWEAMGKFVNYVDVSLRRFCEQKHRVQQFKLFINLLDVEHLSLIDRWIELAAENGVKEFDFRIITDSETWYTLPQCVFSAKEIINLYLSGCIFVLKDPVHRDAIKFHSLQKLSLDEVLLDEEIMEVLIKNCPMIEHFFLRYCIGIENFHVPRLCKLRNVHWYSACPMEPKRIEIEASSLQHFAFHYRGPSRIPCIFNLDSCQYLKTLSLEGYIITDELLDGLIPKFPILEQLFLVNCKILKRFKISSDKLKMLLLDKCLKLEQTEIDAPNLRSFQYIGHLIPSSKINAPGEWKVSLDIQETINNLWYLKFKEFLANSNQVSVLLINIYSMEYNTFDLEELSDVSLSPYVELDKMILNIQSPAINYEDLVAALFWSGHPKALYVILNGKDENRFIKYLNGKLMDKEDPSCCSSHHIKCWWHFLKDAKIESYEGTASKRHVHCFTSPDSLEYLKKSHVLYNLKWSS